MPSDMTSVILSAVSRRPSSHELDLYAIADGFTSIYQERVGGGGGGGMELFFSTLTIVSTRAS